jgi:Ala-tRNA(Pro) deacylase
VSWLSERGLDFELEEHDMAYTALHTARVAGVLPSTFAKVVVVETGDGQRVMLALEATDHLDLAKARRVLDVAHLRLVDEAELAAAAPDCEVGAVPAIGCLYGMPMYADLAIADNVRLSFNAGSHAHAVRLNRGAWERATGVVYADLARRDDYRLGFTPF